MKFFEAALKHRQITLLLTLIFVLAGMHSLQHMPRREDPKMTIRQGLVIMLYPGATTLEMEEQVTKKVEALLFRYEEVKKDETESTTKDGEMIIQVELQEWLFDKDRFWSKARHDLNELKAELPPGVIGPIINSDFGDTVALLIAVSSQRHSYSELEDFLEIIEDELRPLAEVSKLKRYGEQAEQIYVTTDSRKLSQYGLTHGQVVEALQSMNTITYAGEIKSGGAQIPVHTTHLYGSIDQIEHQIVDISSQGQVVRLKDVAGVVRRYEEPDAFIRLNGQKAVLLSVEMQNGFNIVEFGHKVDQRLAVAQERIPSDVSVKKTIDQPQVVDANISHFMKEFAIAIAAVILVTMLLLPLRVAMVAALAIPITIMITFGFLDYFNINLQQMTLAGLIVVLGMVVDNAIVIVDDYVERLDQGASTWQAAVKSATDLFVPVFSATLAIICAFIPLNLILTGNSQEFLHTLPIAVLVALLVSLVVAVFLIPLLCHVFIKRGLHSGHGKKPRFSFLDGVQRLYDTVLSKAFKWPRLTILLGILSVVGTVGLAALVPVRMFPNAQRDQFCLEVYMDKGNRLEATDLAVRKVETLLAADNRILEVTSFIGTASPRFYMTYAPQFPDKNYAQILIATRSAKDTEELVTKLVPGLHHFLPNGEILVKQLVQGPPVEAPIEVRVKGNDLAAIRHIGEDITALLKNTEGTNFIRTTFQQDYYGLRVKVNEEVANRLGFASQDIARMLGGGLKGVPVSTLWEGDHPVDILLRLDAEQRDAFDDIDNIYLVSPVTGAKVTLRQLADLEPEWQHGRIRRRNGVRTLTVRTEAQLGRMPNDILAEIKPKIDAMELPPGITIDYGGELEDQEKVMGEQTTSLLTSLVLIFMVLLFQFKGIGKSLIIMAAIPMSWFGAFLGLYVTGNPFSFTGFLGVISLSGLVVRNGIILVEYADKLTIQDDSRDLKSVAMDAGKRRMRPVFLTAMAAAMGVVPMIISGSPLWGPLGSVLAVGLVFGMALTLLVMPVLYWKALQPGRKRVRKKVGMAKSLAVSVVALLMFYGAGVPSVSADDGGAVLTLPQAIDIAMERNPAMGRSTENLIGAEHAEKSARAEYFPTLSADYTYTALDRAPYMITGGRRIQVAHDDQYQWGLRLVQPLFTGFAISSRHKMGKLGVEIKEKEKQQTVLDIARGVKGAYYRVLLAQKMEIVADEAVHTLSSHEEEARMFFDRGIIRRNDLLRAKVTLSNAVQFKERTHADTRIAVADLNRWLCLDIHADTRIADIDRVRTVAWPLDALIEKGLQTRPQLQAMVLVRESLTHAISLEKSARYPQVAAVAGYLQHGDSPEAYSNDYENDHNAAIGLQATWTLFDGRKTRSRVGKAASEKRAYEETMREVQDRVRLEIKSAHLDLGVAENNIETARVAVSQAEENLRITRLGYRQEAATSTEVLDARTDLTQAQTNYYTALYSYLDALAALERAVGQGLDDPQVRNH
ncbi:efflux RND transporter permease subunit [Desulfatitalea tepidiphila]|uniref:efflux RND transporter permease subunit n=1 Tax=Desulfatitalea tepidiphila TaxID=1185843 RepID=UPI0006B62002|nr:efflux RND transporter permease subunit [Desulfatitalea tepidiphila]